MTVASAPDSLSLKQDGETTVIVSWTVPTPPGDTTGYKYIIQYHKQDTENETMVNSTSMLKHTITDLQPLTVYVIEVTAVNDAGIGIYGNITAKTKSCKLQSF